MPSDTTRKRGLKEASSVVLVSVLVLAASLRVFVAMPEYRFDFDVDVDVRERCVARQREAGLVQLIEAITPFISQIECR